MPTRRDFLAACSAATLCIPKPTQAAGPKALANKLGITTSSVGSQLAGRGKPKNFTLLELPHILNNEFGFEVIDLNTSSLASTKKSYLDKLRKATDDAGCILTNLKMNQRNLKMGSIDKDARSLALSEYKKSIDVAAHLGLRWARPLPRAEKPDRKTYVASYQELAKYAAEKEVTMLVENFGWMQNDSESVVKLIKEVGDNVEACPDTGNWDSKQLRIDGLKKTFPIAVTCDFKARKLGPKGEHPLYDLKQCFEIGWQAGFRGPWCFEHANTDTNALFRELNLLGNMLRDWTKLSDQAKTPR
ncbi:MAG: hypothetical protein CMJ78_18105 [Planctomycetaceae bacterium]|nr:hypothetical protein [Planctomycetaceae bacterium]